MNCPKCNILTFHHEMFIVRHNFGVGEYFWIQMRCRKCNHIWEIPAKQVPRSEIPRPTYEG